MKKKRKEHKIRSFLGQVLPYFAMFLMIVGVAKVGIDTKSELDNGGLSMNAMAASDYNISADQLSTLYAVASLSNSFDLASVDTVATSYVVASAMKEISQTGADKLEKPSLINTNISRGVETYTVKEGETMAYIALKFGLSTDQIRWSNGLKTTDVNPGDLVRIPSVAGIVYTAKNGDTPESLASRYGSSAERIIAYNDLEGGSIVEGAQIVLPGGVLPETERPEYVAPVYSPSYSFGYTYAGSSAGRQNMSIIARGFYANSPGNGSYAGQCTWYAYYWRATDPRSQGALPSGALGHAYSWAYTLRAAGYRVDNNPEVGAVFQTSSGGSGYGHVGVVLAVNGDGSVLVREMNLAGTYVVTEGTIPASSARSFNYIHGRY